MTPTRTSLLAPLLLVALALLVAAGCGTSPSTPGAKQPKHHTQPQRIVSLAPNVTEILFALGLGDRIVGVTGQCNWPPEARLKKKIGDVSTSVERVVALKPDLVCAHAYLNRESIRSLQALKIRVVAVDPKTLDGVALSIGQIASACGVPDKGAALARKMRSGIAGLAVRRRASKAPKVLFAVQGNPLWAAGPGTFVHEMITRAGGANVARGLNAGFNLFSQEAAVASAPDIIIVTDSVSEEFFKQAAAWKGCPAVKLGRIVRVDPDLFVRPGPRLVDGMRQMSGMLSGWGDKQ